MKLKSLNRAQVEFGWLFALIIGAVIIFLAIFLAGKIFKTGTYLTETEILRNLDIILNPFTSVGSIASLTLSKPIDMPFMTEISVDCLLDPAGQKIMLSQIENGKKSEPVSYTIKNKYIFSEKNFTKKEFWVFSKPLELPWRVDDLIYLVSDEYCFVNPPANIGKELTIINASVITVDDCKDNAIKVCFNGETSCGISVDYHTGAISYGTVRKSSFASDALMYAAIFSDNSIYTCNVKRLLSRSAVQTNIFLGQAETLNDKGCDTASLISKLGQYQTALQTLLKSASISQISGLANLANEIKDADSYNCPIIRK